MHEELGAATQQARLLRHHAAAPRNARPLAPVASCRCCCRACRRAFPRRSESLRAAIRHPPLPACPPRLPFFKRHQHRQAYVAVRGREDVAEMGDLVLGLATELMTCGFNFHPTFTSPFEARASQHSHVAG